MMANRGLGGPATDTATMYSLRSAHTRGWTTLFGHLSHTGVSRLTREEVMATLPTSRATALRTLVPSSNRCFSQAHGQPP